METTFSEQLKNLEPLYASLKKLIGFHRQLLDICRLEREALTQADIRQIQEATLAKQAVVESIRQAEGQRLVQISDLAMQWKKPVRELSLPALIILVQGRDPKGAEALRSAYNTLTVLIQRIVEQNDDNKALVERSIENVNEMKRNVLGEAVPKSNTYTSHGQRAGVTGGARLISQEA